MYLFRVTGSVWLWIDKVISPKTVDVSFIVESRTVPDIEYDFEYEEILWDSGAIPDESSYVWDRGPFVSRLSESESMRLRGFPMLPGLELPPC